MILKKVAEELHILKSDLQERLLLVGIDKGNIDDEITLEEMQRLQASLVKPKFVTLSLSADKGFSFDECDKAMGPTRWPVSVTTAAINSFMDNLYVDEEIAKIMVFIGGYQDVECLWAWKFLYLNHPKLDPVIIKEIWLRTVAVVQFNELSDNMHSLLRVWDLLILLDIDVGINRIMDLQNFVNHGDYNLQRVSEMSVEEVQHVVSISTDNAKKLIQYALESC
jgi:hypothetical protein